MPPFEAKSNLDEGFLDVRITDLITHVRRASVKLARAWKRDTLNNDGEEHLYIYSRPYH
jgi:hypothetical protein